MWLLLYLVESEMKVSIIVIIITITTIKSCKYIFDLSLRECWVIVKKCT